MVITRQKDWCRQPDSRSLMLSTKMESAWEEYKDPRERRGREFREVVARKVVWAAVKKEYEKNPETGK